MTRVEIEIEAERKREIAEKLQHGTSGVIFFLGEIAAQLADLNGQLQALRASGNGNDKLRGFLSGTL
jgi:hypothetical protein